jgi:hypothetical protein
VWQQVRKTVADILSQSNAGTNVWTALQGKYVMALTEPPPPALGVTGRVETDKHNRNRVKFQFAWSRIGDEFRLASILSHEFGHGDQALRRAFTSAEAASFMSIPQYIVLRRWGEYDAYSLQAKVLDEIADATPRFEPCRAEILQNDRILERISASDYSVARTEVIELFDDQRLAEEWQDQRNSTTPQDLSQMGDVKSAVDALVLTQDWQNQRSIWTIP